MFIYQNVLIGLLVGGVAFLLVTFVNVHAFSARSKFTSIILTVNFLYLFFVGPFRIVNDMYSKRKQLENKIKFDKQISEDRKKEMLRIINSKSKIFIMLYKNEVFNYNILMLNFSRWYLNKPFKYKVRLQVKNRNFEQSYLKEGRKIALHQV